MNKSGGKSILITGGARRIGAALTRALARDGWHVCIHCNASLTEAEALLAEIIEDGGSGAVVSADLSRPTAAETLIAKVCDIAPPLVALINNASMFEYDTVSSLTQESLDRHHAVNLRAPMLLSKAFSETLGEGRDGSVINMLDNKVFAINPDYLSYTMSKVALHGATQALAMALAPRIRVNAIAPGITLESGGQGEENFERGVRMSPLGRVSSVEDIVRAARFILATPSLNGQVIAIDGGQHLQKLPRDVAFMEEC
jgi:NAD(P)-dependent dehydrogenase (short-subunit alcohol dehydrogenase family)